MFFKFVYVMMRGEYYAPPPVPTKPAEKFHFKRITKAPPAMTDMLPSEDYGAGADMFGFSGGRKKDESEEEKQYVKYSLILTHELNF